MQRSKIFMYIIVGLIFFLTACEKSEPAQILPEQLDIYFFHDTICASCDGTEEFFALVKEKITDVRELYPYQIITANIYKTDGRIEYERITDQLGLDRDSLSLPLMIAGGRVFSGLETIGDNLREAYLVAGEDLFVRGEVYNPKHKKTGDLLFADYTANPQSATLVYFYRSTCDECNETIQIIDSLPETVIVNGKSTATNVIRMNTRSGNNGERITAFFEAYDVPEENQMVPIVFLSDGYLAGYEAIAAEALSRLEDGAGAGFQFP